MIPINLTELTTLLELPAPRVGGDEMVRSVTTDSRTARTEGVFVAIDGERHRGSDHAVAALRRGALAVVSPRIPEASGADGRIFVVADPRAALLRLAADQRRRCPARVAAITGSNGKTTTKDLLGTLMKRQGETVVAANSFNNAIGLSLTLLEATSSTKWMILEIGTNAPGEV
ncbi:MAG: UDP-N-acetylmuramoyl-tripeptide--D-alanyl-D-alanine ligase, partial [Planctomycetes bacterium]|nr:UDP-N-acetylmuramoyl-tripeptide--D-alanyl-D-alanine ligase [Planctomycetota bacterium]